MKEKDHMSKKIKEESIAHDKRILYRKLSQGTISEKELQIFTKKLPDMTENAEELSFSESEKEK